MPIAPAIPFIGPAIGAIGSLFGAHQASKQADTATTPSAAETAAQQAQARLGNQQADQGGQLFRQGNPQLQQAGKYFSTLASGNRAATTQALAPAVQNINSVYGGTARTLGRFLRGPERDTEMASAERERAGQIGSLFRDAPTQANSQLATLGGGQVAAGMGGTNSAAGIFGSQASQQASNRLQGGQVQQGFNAQARQSGSDFGGLMFNLLSQFGNKGSSAITPSSPGADAAWSSF